MCVCAEYVGIDGQVFGGDLIHFQKITREKQNPSQKKKMEIKWFWFYLCGGFFEFTAQLDELLAGRFTFVLALTHSGRLGVQLPLCQKKIQIENYRKLFNTQKRISMEIS